MGVLLVGAVDELLLVELLLVEVVDDAAEVLVVVGAGELFAGELVAVVPAADVVPEVDVVPSPAQAEVPATDSAATATTIPIFTEFLHIDDPVQGP